jgi:hypothetical protein
MGTWQAFLKVIIIGVLAVYAIFNLWYWARRRFWAPWWLHSVAGTGLLFGIYMAWPDIPSEWSRALFLIFVMPVTVYVSFAIYFVHIVARHFGDE